ncbi:hypothetical protein ACFWFQ_33830 [Nocardia salmonicida]|uniref:hypothetical protein n=1 Tax=Nocardia salmonicida TaxID=53431 RepID=UPI0036614ABD
MFEEHHIGRKRAPGSESNPCLGHVRIGVEELVDHVSVVVDHWMLCPKHMVLDLFEVGSGEVGAVSSQLVSQGACHLVDVTVVAAKPGVCLLCPIEGCRVVTWTNRPTRMHLFGRIGLSVY